MRVGSVKMGRARAAAALLLFAACIACFAAAPVNEQTGLDLYENGAKEGCYYNFQHYGEGDRITTNEPCLNCTCHNRMLMCYLRVCPFTKPIGHDCAVEKRGDQCCPVITCPDVPVDLLTSTSTTSPAEYGSSEVGHLDKYGCSINGKFFAEGSKVPPNPNKPCELCYCIRNMTACVMQECTLHVDGCTPVYQKDVCCPVRYSCDHPDDEVLMLDDMTTTTRPTPGFLLPTTTLSSISQDCVHQNEVYADGVQILTEKACEHCYCMKGDIVCVVQECGTPMENEGKNCTSLPPREGQCCPDTYICEGDTMVEDKINNEVTTYSPIQDIVSTFDIEGSGEGVTKISASTTQILLAEEGSGLESTTIVTDIEEHSEATHITPIESFTAETPDKVLTKEPLTSLQNEIGTTTQRTTNGKTVTQTQEEILSTVSPQRSEKPLESSAHVTAERADEFPSKINMEVIPVMQMTQVYEKDQLFVTYTPIELSSQKESAPKLDEQPADHVPSKTAIIMELTLNVTPIETIDEVTERITEISSERYPEPTTLIFDKYTETYDIMTPTNLNKEQQTHTPAQYDAPNIETIHNMSTQGSENPVTDIPNNRRTTMQFMDVTNKSDETLIEKSTETYRKPSKHTSNTAILDQSSQTVVDLAQETVQPAVQATQFTNENPSQFSYDESTVTIIEKQEGQMTESPEHIPSETTEENSTKRSYESSTEPSTKELGDETTKEFYEETTQKIYMDIDKQNTLQESIPLIESTDEENPTLHAVTSSPIDFANTSSVYQWPEGSQEPPIDETPEVTKHPNLTPSESELHQTGTSKPASTLRVDETQSPIQDTTEHLDKDRINTLGSIYISNESTTEYPLQGSKNQQPTISSESLNEISAQTEHTFINYETETYTHHLADMSTTSTYQTSSFKPDESTENILEDYTQSILPSEETGSIKISTPSLDIIKESSSSISYDLHTNKNKHNSSSTVRPTESMHDEEEKAHVESSTLKMETTLVFASESIPETSATIAAAVLQPIYKPSTAKTPEISEKIVTTESTDSAENVDSSLVSKSTGLILETVSITESFEIHQTTDVPMVHLSTEPTTRASFDTSSTSLPDQSENEIKEEEAVTGHILPHIPGEGDCLVDGITYSNDSSIVSTNKCQNSCKCVSSIVKCEPIECSPPPENMNNCEPMYDSKDACCPMYVCDHAKETLAPQSHNQMLDITTEISAINTESETTPRSVSPVTQLEDCISKNCEVKEEEIRPVQIPELCAFDKCSPVGDASIPNHSDDFNKPSRQEEHASVSTLQPSQDEHPIIPVVVTEECTGKSCSQATIAANLPTILPSEFVSELPVVPCFGEDCDNISAPTLPDLSVKCDKDCNKFHESPQGNQLNTSCVGEHCMSPPNSKDVSQNKNCISDDCSKPGAVPESPSAETTPDLVACEGDHCDGSPTLATESTSKCTGDQCELPKDSSHSQECNSGTCASPLDVPSKPLDTDASVSPSCTEGQCDVSKDTSSQDCNDKNCAVPPEIPSVSSDIPVSTVSACVEDRCDVHKDSSSSQECNGDNNCVVSSELSPTSSDIATSATPACTGDQCDLSKDNSLSQECNGENCTMPPEVPLVSSDIPVFVSPACIGDRCDVHKDGSSNQECNGDKNCAVSVELPPISSDIPTPASASCTGDQCKGPTGDSSPEKCNGKSCDVSLEVSSISSNIPTPTSLACSGDQCGISAENEGSSNQKCSGENCADIPGVPVITCTEDHCESPAHVYPDSNVECYGSECTADISSDIPCSGDQCDETPKSGSAVKPDVSCSGDKCNVPQISETHTTHKDQSTACEDNDCKMKDTPCNGKQCNISSDIHSHISEDCISGNCSCDNGKCDITVVSEDAREPTVISTESMATLLPDTDHTQGGSDNISSTKSDDEITPTLPLADHNENEIQTSSLPSETTANILLNKVSETIPNGTTKVYDVTRISDSPSTSETQLNQMTAHYQDKFMGISTLTDYKTTESVPIGDQRTTGQMEVNEMTTISLLESLPGVTSTSGYTTKESESNIIEGEKQSKIPVNVEKIPSDITTVFPVYEEPTKPDYQSTIEQVTEQSESNLISLAQNIPKPMEEASVQSVPSMSLDKTSTEYNIKQEEITTENVNQGENIPMDQEISTKEKADVEKLDTTPSANMEEFYKSTESSPKEEFDTVENKTPSVNLLPENQTPETQITGDGSSLTDKIPEISVQSEKATEIINDSEITTHTIPQNEQDYFTETSIYANGQLEEITKSPITEFSYENESSPLPEQTDIDAIKDAVKIVTIKTDTLTTTDGASLSTSSLDSELDEHISLNKAPQIEDIDNPEEQYTTTSGVFVTEKEQIGRNTTEKSGSGGHATAEGGEKSEMFTIAPERETPATDTYQDEESTPHDSNEIEPDDSEGIIPYVSELHTTSTSKILVSFEYEADQTTIAYKDTKMEIPESVVTDITVNPSMKPSTKPQKTITEKAPSSPSEYPNNQTADHKYPDRVATDLFENTIASEETTSISDIEAITDTTTKKEEPPKAYENMYESDQEQTTFAIFVIPELNEQTTEFLLTEPQKDHNAKPSEELYPTEIAKPNIAISDQKLGEVASMAPHYIEPEYHTITLPKPIDESAPNHETVVSNLVPHLVQTDVTTKPHINKDEQSSVDGLEIEEDPSRKTTLSLASYETTTTSADMTLAQITSSEPISAPKPGNTTIENLLNKAPVTNRPAETTETPTSVPQDFAPETTTIADEIKTTASIVEDIPQETQTPNRPELIADEKGQSTPPPTLVLDEEHRPIISEELPGTSSGPGDLPSPGDDAEHQSPEPFPSPGYGGESDYEQEEDQAFGPGTCRYGGKVYVSAQQIPRDDPCDFCFCFRSDIICLQQSCPPPIHGCHEEPISGFCCPRYECPVSMATMVNVTTTTTTTTTTLPPHFLPHAYKGAAQRRGCYIKGHTYQVGEVVSSSSGPCLHCTCGGDGKMKCDPKVCTPEPMLRQMIAAAVSTERRR